MASGHHIKYKIAEDMDIGQRYTLRITGEVVSKGLSTIRGRVWEESKPVSRSFSRSFRTPDLLEAKKMELLSAANSWIAERQRHDLESEHAREDYTAYKYQKAFAAVEADPSLFTNWKVSRKKILRNFQKNFLPMLEARADFVEIDADELEKMYEERVAQAKQNLNYKGKEEPTRKKKQIEFIQYEQIYREMRKVDPSLPVVVFDELLARTLVGDLEQLRSIDEKYRQKFWRILEDSVETMPIVVFCAVLEATGGLRGGEASMVFPDEVVYEGDYCYIFVLRQAVQNQASDVLKRTSSYRPVIMSHWSAVMLRRCAEQIEIPEDRTKPLMPKDDVRDCITELMKRSGMEEMLEQHKASLVSAFGEKVVDNLFALAVRPHLLRADFASRMRAICGFTSDELDLELGHEPATKHRGKELPDFGLKSVRAELAAKMERYIYNPEISKNPEVHAVELRNGVHAIEPYRITKMTASSAEDKELEIDIEAAEPAEEIEVILPRAATEITPRSIPGVRDRREIIGSCEEIEEENNEDKECFPLGE